MVKTPVVVNKKNYRVTIYLNGILARVIVLGIPAAHFVANL